MGGSFPRHRFLETENVYLVLRIIVYYFKVYVGLSRHKPGEKEEAFSPEIESCSIKFLKAF